jgi:hypothetical protein
MTTVVPDETGWLITDCISITLDRDALIRAVGAAVG